MLKDDGNGAEINRFARPSRGEVKYHTFSNKENSLNPHNKHCVFKWRSAAHTDLDGPTNIKNATKLEICVVHSCAFPWLDKT